MVLASRRQSRKNMALGSPPGTSWHPTLKLSMANTKHATELATITRARTMTGLLLFYTWHWHSMVYRGVYRADKRFGKAYFFCLLYQQGEVEKKILKVTVLCIVWKEHRSHTDYFGNIMKYLKSERRRG
jgi:hypothetical protein